jgi:hypothetical protein
MGYRVFDSRSKKLHHPNNIPLTPTTRRPSLLSKQTLPRPQRSTPASIPGAYPRCLPSCLSPLRCLSPLWCLSPLTVPKKLSVPTDRTPRREAVEAQPPPHRFIRSEREL